MISGPTAAVITAAAVIGGLLSPFLDSASLEARRGAESYAEGDWVGAAERFKKAAEETANPELRYNLGAAAYQGQNYPEALEAFGSVPPSGNLSGDRIAYDTGNALYKTGNPEGALDAYRRALRENPQDEDARFNYELVLKQMQNQSSDKNQEQKDQKDQEGDSSNDRNSDSQSSPPDSSGQSPPKPGEKQGDQQQQQEQQPQAGEGNDQKASDEKPSAAEPKEGEPQFLRSEDAMRLLDAVTPEERELIRARLRSSGRKKVEKDW